MIRLHWWLGPELYWLVLYFCFGGLAARNVPATASGNQLLNAAVWCAATLGVLGAFAFLALPGNGRAILLARSGIAAFIGLNACVLVACEAIHYPEPGRDSGLMGLWIMAAICGALVWLVAAAVTLLYVRNGPGA